MAGGADKEDGGMFASINVTPLVDITLVLLIIFMVAAPLIVANPSIKVALPKAASGDETQKSTLALTLERQDPGGYKLYTNGKATDEGSMRTVVAAAVKSEPQLQAVIAADRGIPYGDVMHVVDVIKALGVSRFALNTQASP
ncbi:MAG TPA: biopolymer transporter ExbD [Polyangia bacterium]|nr:biopolymer transporter ExbD [Polyangia bacterium]